MKSKILVDAHVAITFGHLLLFLIALPFDRFYSQLALISLTIHLLIHFKKSNIERASVKPALLISALYALLLLGTVYSNYRAEALRDWEKQLALLLFPFLFLVSKFDFAKYKLSLLTAFATTCAVTIIYLYYNVFKIIAYNHLPISAVFSSVFLNHNFSAPIDLHATYLSMYVLLSIVIYLLLIIRGSPHRWWYLIPLAILSAGLLQLSSRAVFISAVIVLNILVPFFLLKGRKRWQMMGLFAAVALGAFIGILRIDAFKSRYVVELKEDLTQIADHNELLEPRIGRWKVALDLIWESPILGHGSGSEIEMLKGKYFERKLYNSYLNQLNAHNQYLSLQLKYGLIGLCLYLYLLYFGFRKAIQSKDMTFLAFILMIAIVSFSENILDVNKGIFFFSFFYSYFLFSNININQRKKTEATVSA